MKISNYYGNTASSKANATKLSSNGIDIYFSYETIVAISVNGKMTIAKNIWVTLQENTLIVLTEINQLGLIIQKF